MNREKTLVKNTIIISIGIICTKLITFFLLPLYTRLLSTEDYGIVDLLGTLSLLLVPVITLQIEQAVFRELIEARNNEKRKKEIISSSFLILLIQCGIFFLIFLLISPWINNDYKYFIVFNVIISIFSSLLLQISRGLGDNKRYAIGSFISAAGTIIFNLIFLVLLNMKGEGMLYGIVLGQITCLLYLFVFLKIPKYLSIKDASFSVVKKLWKYSIPLVPNSLSWWVFGSSDRIIVSIFLGLSMNGILSVSSKFSVAYALLYSIFDRSWIESVVLHIDDKDIENYFNKIFNIILKLFFSLMILIIVVMSFVYKIFINGDFRAGYNLIPFLMLGVFFNVLQGLVVVIYVAKKNTKSIAKTSAVAAVLNIITHLGLIKFIGIYAAAISTVVAHLSISIYRFTDVNKKYMKIRINKQNLIYYLTITPIVFIIYFINNPILNVVSMIVSIIVILIINRDILKFVIDYLKKKKGSLKYAK